MVPSHKRRNVICNCIDQPHYILFIMLENNMTVKIHNEAIKKVNY